LEPVWRGSLIHECVKIVASYISRKGQPHRREVRLLMGLEFYVGWEGEIQLSDSSGDWPKP
jgi:hypothetical protein